MGAGIGGTGSRIIQPQDSLHIVYGSNHQRIKQIMYSSQNGTTTKTYFGGLYERIEYSDGTYRELTYLQAPTGVFGVASIDHQNNRSINYFLKDHLGSIAIVTDESGNKIEDLNFDAWGRRRNPTNWSYNNVPTSFLFDRGYTGHEHLDEFGLINMNGRVYDPFVARFLSPDPLIQSPENPQNYNSYSYCLNNPLRYTDPSGYSFLGFAEKVIKGYINIFTAPARILSAANDWLNDQINGTPNPHGYFTLDYIAKGILPGPGNTFYLPNQGTEYSYRSWPQGVGDFVPGDANSILMNGTNKAWAVWTTIARQQATEQGDYNQMEISIDMDSKSWVETPGMSYNPQPDDPPKTTGEESTEEKKAANYQAGGSWDLNADGILQKNEADYWWLNGKGVGITVDNSKIDWTGLKIPQGLSSGDIFAISTTDAFLKLPYETASTYGGTSFEIVDPSQVMVLDQLYHYNYRPNNSLENRVRNFMNWLGRPSKEGVNFMIYYNNPNILLK